MNELFARLDPDQRAAVELRINGTVSAGAGSGKTTVLAARYLDLLLKADSGGEVGAADLRSILCLTFTRKAAAEMRARIWRELSKDGSPRARAAAARFSEATISTIDSFCGSVLRSSAQRYGFAPDFGVDENEARRIALDEALRFLLARREDPALRELFSYQSFMTAWRDLFAEAGHRFATPVPDRRADPAATPARARAALLRIALSALDAIESARGEALELGDLGIKAGADFVAALEAFPADSREALHCAAQGRGDEGIEAIAEASRRAGALRDLGLRFGKGDGGDKDRLKEAAKAAREAARLLAACAVAAGRRGLEDRIVELLVEFAALVVEAKRRAGIMGFHDVIVATVDLLASDRRIRAWWKARYRWIMVDEFQDDDELQKDLFFLLAEGAETEGEGIPEASELAPDKLFFVGDDKQSIYRFRGADVAVFNRLGRELGGGRAREEGGTAPAMPRLRTNYRSEPRLIEFFNEVFASLLASGEAEDYEARFEKSLARKPTPGIEASVSLLLKIKGESAEEETRSDDEALAEGIARHIESLVSSEGCLVPDGEGGARRANWDDIAILLRSSSKQYLVERFLRLHDIPHGAASVRSLFVESPANDLLSLLKLALIPTDRAALATFLRSPFVRISDEGFIAVLAEATGFEAAETALDLSAKDGLRLAAARRLLAETRRRIDRMPLASLLSWLWHECGLRISILSDPAAQPFLEHFDWLFALAVAADRNGESLAAFLDRLAPLLGTPDKPEDEIEAPREARKGVHIMTVHKSKGLEFPIVVIPWVENRGMGESKGPAWYESEDAGISLNLRDWREPGATSSNLFFDAARDRESALSLAETKRLFYVACTRASTHLVFAGILPKKPPETSFLHFLGLRAGEEGLIGALPTGLRMKELPELLEEDYRRLAGRRRGLPPSLQAAAYAKASLIERAAASRLVPATAVERLAWEADPRRNTPTRRLPASAYDEVADRLSESRFGDLCHAFIEAKIAGRLLDPGHSALLALPEDLRAPLLAEASRLAEGFFSSSIADILAKAKEVFVEKKLLLALGAIIVRARLDLVLVTEEEVLVIDWKSGREADSAAYAVQLALYRRALALLYPKRRIRSLIWWLRSAEAEELNEDFDRESLEGWAAAAAAADAAEAADAAAVADAAEAPRAAP